MKHRWTIASLALLAGHAGAQEPDVQQVVVTGSAKAQRVLDAPFAITVIDAAALQSAGPMINLSEAAARVPGLTVNNRNNYAQDLQISARGFGARAGFGVRGLRLYSDGIPATMPDGQGQVAHFDLAGAGRIEVLRGPFSVLYGNSSGGVIAVFSAPVRERELEFALDAGSFGLRQGRVKLGVPLGEGLELAAGASYVEIDGFRPQSAATRSLGSLRLAWRGAEDTVTFTLNDQHQKADDPLGLTREQFDTDPYQTTPQALEFDTRKTVRQTQAGVAWNHRAGGDGAWREAGATAYFGKRGVVQYLAIAPAVQASPRHGGGVVDFDRRYSGVDLRSRWGWNSVDVVLGAAIESQADARKGYENFTGSGDDLVLGVRGALRRDEGNAAQTREGYGQLEWRATPELAATAGVRGGRVTFESDDHYLSNGDDSGRLAFSFTNPVVGLRYNASPALTLHASAARGFESPTLGELAYRPDGAAGFNTALQPQTSRQFELGAKARGDTFDLDAAVFLIDTEDEIGVQTNAGGRQSFQNVGRTRRTGAELGATWRIAAGWRAQAALSWLDARYRDDFLICTAAPCTTPSVPVPAGNRVAGTSTGSAFAELAWGFAPGAEAALEWRAAGATAVNDTNSDFAGGWGIAGLRFSQAWKTGFGQLELLARVDNLADRRYAGSVIVNEANGRFFEPAAPRNWWLGLRLKPPV